MKIQPSNKRALLKAALGTIESDMVITNVQLVNVITGEIYPADVFVYDGMIAHVEYKEPGKELSKAKQVVDGEGRYLIPGFIDAHEHIESSMMTPRNFAKGVIPNGTTTVITDPHEIANVCGLEGVRYMHESSEGLPMRQLIDIPSCVPAVPGLENAGAEFLVKEIEELSSLERVIGLAEVMDFLAVINGEDRMMDIIDFMDKKGLYLQGHAPYVSGRMLSAYLCGGPNTCHETRDSDEALEKIRNGMFVDARDSSITKNVKEVYEGVKGIKFFDHLCFCTDDREADDILHVGHLNDVVRAAISYGMDPVTAIKSATYNTAREIHIENLGAIAPGYVADMLLVDSLEELKPAKVFFGGQLVAENGQLVAEIEDRSYPLEQKNTMFVKSASLTDISNTARGIALKWKKVSGISGYYIYRKSAADPTWRCLKQVTSASTTSATDTKAVQGEQYTYQIIPYKKSSGQKYKGSAANEKTMIRMKQMNAPTLKNIGSRSVRVYWKSAKAAEGYQIRYSLKKNMSSSKTMKVTSPQQLTATISRLKKNKTYYVQIRAWKRTGNGTACGPWSSKKSVRIRK